MSHPFDAAIALTPGGDGVFDVATHAGYANMVGPFGRITASTLLHAARLHPQRLGEPLALTVNFAGPVVEGPLRVAARALRTNRSTQHWQLELEQGGELAASATTVFGLRRDTWSATEIAPPPQGLGEPVPVKGLSPRVAWPQRYDMQFVRGGWQRRARRRAGPGARAAFRRRLLRSDCRGLGRRRPAAGGEPPVGLLQGMTLRTTRLGGSASGMARQALWS